MYIGWITKLLLSAGEVHPDVQGWVVNAYACSSIDYHAPRLSIRPCTHLLAFSTFFRHHLNGKQLYGSRFSDRFHVDYSVRSLYCIRLSLFSARSVQLCSYI